MSPHSALEHYAHKHASKRVDALTSVAMLIMIFCDSKGSDLAALPRKRTRPHRPKNTPLGAGKSAKGPILSAVSKMKTVSAVSSKPLLRRTRCVELFATEGAMTSNKGVGQPVKEFHVVLQARSICQQVAAFAGEIQKRLIAAINTDEDRKATGRFRYFWCDVGNCSQSKM